MVCHSMIKIIAGLLVGLFCYVNGAHAFLQSPHRIPISDLQALIQQKRMKGNIDLKTQRLPLKNGIDAFGIFEPQGSGIITNNVYIYICSEGKCGLHAYVHVQANERNLQLHLDTKKSTFVIKSQHAREYLRVSFPPMWNVQIKGLPTTQGGLK